MTIDIPTERRGLYRDSTGLAEARIAVRALSVAIIPAFVIDTNNPF